MSYDAQKDLDYIEYNILYFMNIIGMGSQSIDSVTIDELVEAARSVAMVVQSSGRVENPSTQESDSTSPTAFEGVNSNLVYEAEPDHLYLRSQRIHLLSSMRRFWYLRQVALGALNRE
jgi:hypothetical protein